MSLFLAHVSKFIWLCVDPRISCQHYTIDTQDLALIVMQAILVAVTSRSGAYMRRALERT